MNTYQRKLIRLRDFDYSSSNLYFVTICVKDFHCILGSINNGIMGLTNIGNIAAVYMQQIEEIRTMAIVDEFIVMPNHVHCIIELQNKITVSEYRK